MSSETKDYPEGIASKTQKFDLWRNTCNGIVEASFASTCLLVAIRYFDASDTAKSLLASGGAIGFLFAPIFLNILEIAINMKLKWLWLALYKKMKFFIL